MFKNKMSFLFIAIFFGAVFSQAVPTFGQVCTPPPPNMVAWFPGDGNAHDISPGSNNGFVGSQTAFSAGKVAQAFQFNGNSLSQISVPDSPSLHPTNALTVDAWINPATGNNGFPSIIFKGNIGTFAQQPYGLFFNTSNNTVSLRIGNETTVDGLSSSAAIPLNAYTHIAFTYDGATIRIYINGALDNSKSTTIGTLNQTETNPLIIGSFFDNFIGAVDEVEIFNRALSQTEIQAIVTADSAGKCKPIVPTPATSCNPAPVGLAAWFPGDNNALDIRGGNNGTLGGQTAFAAGKVAQAFQFNGASQNASVVTVPDSPPLHITDALTIDAWVNPISGDAIVLKGNFGGGNTQPYGILVGATTPTSEQIIFSIGNNSTFDRVASGSFIPLNAYTHITGTYDGTTMRIYVNGVLDMSKTTAIGTLNTTDTTPLHIGQGYNVPYVGAVDELEIFNRALSDTEVFNIYNAEVNGKCKPTATVSPSGQVAWFAGDGNASDISGNDNNGTLDGATFAVGKVGQAFRFNGNGNRVLVGNAANLQLQTFTIEGWIKRASSTIVTNNPSDTTYGLIFAYGQGGYGIGIQPDGRLFSTKFGGLITNSALTITDTNYHHVVVTVSGTSLLFYVDGASESQTISSQTYTFSTNAAIGARGDDVLNSFYGNIDELSVYNRVLSISEIQSIVNAGIAGKLKQAPTPAGFAALLETSSTENSLIPQTRNATNAGVKSLKISADKLDFSPQAVNVAVGDATITFPSITTAGITQEIPLNLATLPPLPSGTSSGLIYDIATSAVYTGTPTVCFNLPALAGVFPNLRIYHLEGSVWKNRTATSGNTATNFCSTPLSSLSPFAIIQAVPTSADVSVSGRVLTPDGRGLTNARVVLTDAQGNLRMALSGSFGYYHFDGIAVGETYILNISSKRYQFNPEAVYVTEDINELNFLAVQ
jgi:hypothetical protein